jgi:hypothetical protein
MSLQSPTATAPLDGNAAAGILGSLFAIEITAATLICEGCGASAQVGAAAVYGGRMGVILRCRNCGTAMLRMARTRTGLRLDMRGAQSLAVDIADA